MAIDRARIDRQIRELALEHAAGRLEDAVYLERLHELRDAKESLERTSADGIAPERAVAWLRELSATWRAAEVPAEKADLLHAIYDRITVAGMKIVSVRPHSVGVRPRIRARTARKGCSGAPDRIRTCDLRLRRPTLYPLSYRRAGHDHTG